MNGSLRRSRPFWRVAEPRVPRPELWIAALVLVAMMLIDVWQNSRVAQLCVRLDHSRSTLQKAQARLEFERATLEHRSTRSELAPVAAALGLVPMEASQLVNLPSDYLADDAGVDVGEDAAPRGTPAERMMRALVPDARASRRAKD